MLEKIFPEKGIVKLINDYSRIRTKNEIIYEICEELEYSFEYTKKDYNRVGGGLRKNVFQYHNIDLINFFADDIMEECTPETKDKSARYYISMFIDNWSFMVSGNHSYFDYIFIIPSIKNEVQFIKDVLIEIEATPEEEKLLMENSNMFGKN